MHKRAAFLRSAQYEQVSRALPRNAQRATIVQRLIDATGVLDEAFDVFEVEPASARAMQLFHSREYVDALQKSRDARQRTDYGLVDDCSAFRSVFELASLEAGGSVQAAQLLGSGMYDSAIWWGGGRHHAKTDCAAGYCYVNDVVLAILELLKSFERVMYIDIDVHHGDGVEEAFCYSDSVLTCSFHHHAPLFFPGSGALADQGGQRGKQAVINVPLHEGCSDDTFIRIFDHTIRAARISFAPTAVVLQCGADALAGDPLGEFNLTEVGYTECLLRVRKAMPHVPLLLLGGGGYHQFNTARCWACLTHAAVEREVPRDIPEHDFCEEYAPDFSFAVRPSYRRDYNHETHIKTVCNVINRAISSVPRPAGVQNVPAGEEGAGDGGGEGEAGVVASVEEKKQETGRGQSEVRAASVDDAASGSSAQEEQAAAGMVQGEGVMLRGAKEQSLGVGEGAESEVVGDDRHVEISGGCANVSIGKDAEVCGGHRAQGVGVEEMLTEIHGRSGQGIGVGCRGFREDAAGDGHDLSLDSSDSIESGLSGASLPASDMQARAQACVQACAQVLFSGAGCGGAGVAADAAADVGVFAGSHKRKLGAVGGMGEEQNRLHAIVSSCSEPTIARSSPVDAAGMPLVHTKGIPAASTGDDLWRELA